MSVFVYFISVLIVAQHVSGKRVPIIRSSRLRDIIALYWYVPWLHQLDVTFVFFTSIVIVDQHVSGKRVPSPGAEDCVML